MSSQSSFPSAPVPGVKLMRNLGLEPDPWQIEVLEGEHSRLLLNCCRQAGKTTVVALLALAEVICVPGTRVLLLSRSMRQAREIYRGLIDFYGRLQGPMRERQTAEELWLKNQSRVVCVPCKEETIRGYANISLLVIDEAARVPDSLYQAVRPMLAVSGGRLICLSTPYGKRGFFYKAWAKGGDDWQRIEVPATSVPRISPKFLEQERRALGLSWFRQEYFCSFESVEGLVYPNFERCVVATVPNPLDGQRVGGIDFGFRNPFAAVWGTLDKDGILWLTGEHYDHCRPLSYHATKLPRDVMWYCDPSGANERAELHCAGFKVRQGKNDLRLGIAAVTARMENGTLRIQKGSCPALLEEAGLYRYGNVLDDHRSEAPVDEHNHALAALRYLIATLDAKRMAGPPPAKPPAPPRRPPTIWEMLKDERLWTYPPVSN